jgi:hypothetical protein
MTTSPLDLQGATAVVFTLLHDPQGGQATFSVTDPREVHRIVSLVKVKPWDKGVPLDQHVLTVSFRSISSSVEIDFCQDCFGRDQMPEAFYEEFRRLARQHGWRELDSILWTVKHD